MGFSRLTSGERKRLRQGILKPEEAVVVSARAQAKNPQGFWSTTWGQVIRGVGIAALNFIPGVGGIASTAVGSFDQARAQALQRNANASYSAALAARGQAAAAARPRPVTPPPFLETGDYPWAPNYGSIGGGYYSGGSPAAPSTGAGTLVDDLVQSVSEFQPWQWVVIAAVGLLLIFGLMRG